MKYILSTLLVVSFLFACSKDESKKQSVKVDYKSFVAKDFDQSTMQIFGEPAKNLDALWIILYADKDGTAKYKLQGKKDGQMITEQGSQYGETLSFRLESTENGPERQVTIDNELLTLKTSADNREESILFYFKKHSNKKGKGKC